MKARAGFTLIELLIYIAITSIALVVFMNFMADTTASAARAKKGQELQQSARFIFDRLSQVVRQAPSVTATATSITTPSDSFTYDGAAILKLNSVPMTSTNIAVTQFTPTAAGTGVTVHLQLSTTNATPVQSIDVNTTLYPHQSLYQ